MTHTKKWQELSDKIIPELLEEFYHPLIVPKATVEEKLKRGNTAYFDFITNSIHVLDDFMETLSEEGKIDRETALRGVLKHEIGHCTIPLRGRDAEVVDSDDGWMLAQLG